MARITGLRSDYQSELRNLLRELLDLAGPIPEPQSVGRQLWSQLRRLEADGADWAAHAIDALGPGSLRGYVTQTLKEDVGSIRIYNNGWVELPSRYAIRPRDPETSKYIGGFQLPMWAEMTWQQFMEMLAGLTNQQGTLSRRIAALNEVLKLRERFPESRSPGEACLMAGIDPQKFEITDEAI